MPDTNNSEGGIAERFGRFREGPYYEDLVLNSEIYHPRGRTITEADCVWMSLITGDRNQIHYNRLYSELNFPWEPFNGRMAVNGLFVLMVVNALTSPETSVSGIFLGIDQLRMISPVFPGDTLTAKSRVVEKRVSRKRPSFGIVTIEVEGYSNMKTLVISYKKTFMLPLRSAEVAEGGKRDGL